MGNMGVRAAWGHWGQTRGLENGGGKRGPHQAPSHALQPSSPNNWSPRSPNMPCGPALTLCLAREILSWGIGQV